MPRLFTALEIPRHVGDSLAIMRGGLPGARWIDPDNYHLTLRFIGDIDDALARDIAGLLGLHFKQRRRRRHGRDHRARPAPAE
jgi:2'-5' RNA ligase